MIHKKQQCESENNPFDAFHANFSDQKTSSFHEWNSYLVAKSFLMPTEINNQQNESIR